MRASDSDRDRAIGKLRHAYGSGLLSTDTFEARVERAVALRDAGELGQLVEDCPERPSALPGWRGRVRAIGLRGLFARTRELEAPPPASGAFAIGRSTECARVFEDRTVSRVHAQLRWVNGGWVLSDLGSMNGTWVNGWRIQEAWVRDGDRVQLGAVELKFRTAQSRPWR
jgi:hypothetical protein